MSPIYCITLVFLIVVTLLAFWRGGRWEKLTATALVSAWLLTALGPFDHRETPWVAVAADGMVFLFLLYAALRSGRRWAQAAAGFQFLILATHYAFASNRSLEQWAYVSAYYVWNIAVIAALLTGIIWRARQPPL